MKLHARKQNCCVNQCSRSLLAGPAAWKTADSLAAQDRRCHDSNRLSVDQLLQGYRRRLIVVPVCTRALVIVPAKALFVGSRYYSTEDHAPVPKKSPVGPSITTDRMCYQQCTACCVELFDCAPLMISK